MTNGPEAESTNSGDRQDIGNPEQQIAQPIDEHEHIRNIEDPEVQEQVDAAKRLFSEFLQDFGESFDLSDEESVERTLEAARERGIFEAAQKIREYLYDRNISIYGVSYLSNLCTEKCKFCPMGQNQIRIEGIEAQLEQPKMSDTTKSKLQLELESRREKIITLDPGQANEDFQALAALGHNEICILTGEGLTTDYRKLIPYIESAARQQGVREIILNCGQFPQGVYRALLEDSEIPEGVKVQFRVFQETYDEQAYAHFMEQSKPIHGKANFGRRYNSQVYALQEGFDEVGIGALFGLTAKPLTEIEGLRKHSEYIKQKTGKEVKRCCLPLGNVPENSGVEIPHNIPEMDKAKEVTELIYALARLAMPTVSIVSSERDGPELLKTLDKYANHTTLFVHPYPGGNIDALAERTNQPTEYTGKISQASVTPRKIEETLEHWRDKGYHIIGFNPTQKIS